jgi:hypothetical protein
MSTLFTFLAAHLLLSFIDTMDQVLLLAIISLCLKLKIQVLFIRHGCLERMVAKEGQVLSSEFALGITS